HKLLRVGAIRSPAACRGLQPRQAIPHGTRRQYLIALLQGWAKARISRAVPTICLRIRRCMVGTLRFAHPTAL
ncbi:hypothetical protein, partial [Bradyrhizobium zhanjiangense]|uniref:hypothetical protein n=1 Tax=Bradyrhizobium zhanjiangense TaxID=1325107 RepID=UPI0019D6D965